MKITQELSEQIEAFIEGSLSGSELADFEKMMYENEALQQKVRIQKELSTTLKNQKPLDFRRKLIEINKELKNESTNDGDSDIVKKLTTSIYWKVAASFLILIGLSTFFWFNNTPSQDLFAQYYTPYPIGDITRGDEVAVNDDFNEIALRYKKREYANVIPYLENLVQQKPDKEILILCLGNSYLNTNELQKAEALFQSFSTESKHYNDAIWFLSLTYLKMGKDDQTIQLLEKLSSINTIYKRKATNLLSEIK